MVNLIDGQAMRGVLAGTKWDVLTLEHAEYLQNSEAQKLDGSVHIPVARINWVQVV